MWQIPKGITEGITFSFCIIAWAIASAYPVAAAQWTAIGPFGGPAAFVQVDPRRVGTVIAATSNGAIFRSDNRGDSWRPVFFPPQFESTLHALSIDGASGNYYAATSAHAPEYAGLWRSTDAGSTWRLVASLSSVDVWSFTIWSGDPLTMAAGTRTGVFLSRDAGQSWARISPESNRELQPVVSLAFDPKSSSILYAGTPHLPWKTADAGKTWTSLSAGMHDDSDVFSIVVDRDQPTRVYASACSGIYVSGASGSSWRKLTGARGASYRTYFVERDVLEPSTVYAGTNNGLIVSRDRGATWRIAWREGTRAIIRDPASPSTFYLATESGLLRSDDGGDHFKPINSGFCNRRLSFLLPMDKGLIAGRRSSAFTWKFDSERWDSRVLPDEFTVLGLAREDSSQLCAAGPRRFAVSKDGGERWEDAGSPSWSQAGSVACSTQNAMVGANERLFTRSTERGWYASPACGAQRVLRVIRTPGTFALIIPGGLCLSTDGIGWKQVSPLPDAVEVIDAVEASSGALVVATARGLLRSTDQGATWTPVEGELGSQRVNALASDPTRAERVFAICSGLLYGSADGGVTWSRISSERAGTTSIRSLAVPAAKADSIFALTSNQGVYVFPIAF